MQFAGRLAQTCLQISRCGRVRNDLNLLRVGIVTCNDDGDGVFQTLCSNLVAQTTIDYCSSMPAIDAGWSSANLQRATQIARKCVDSRLKHDGAVGIPHWAETSREATVLDIFPLRDNLERCNAALVLHDASRRIDLNAMLSVLKSLNDHEIPVVVFGLLPN